MAQSIGAKPWWNINTGYYQVAGSRKTSVPTVVTYRGYTVVPNNALCWQARHLPTSWWQLLRWHVRAFA